MRRTKSGLPKYCGWNIDQHGKRRVRFRKHGLSTYLAGIPWSEDFMRQYAAALEGVNVQAKNAGAKRTKPGSFDALCVSYYRSPEFRGLKSSTQTMRRNIIERFRLAHGEKPIKGLSRRHVADIIGAKADTPEAANNLLKVLRVLLAYAVDQNMIESNPAAGVKKYRSRGDGFHAWTESEIAQFQERHPIGTRAGLAIALLLYTAQRRGDVIRMGWQHVSGDTIAMRQEKTDTPLLIPLHPELARALASAAHQLDLLGHREGRPIHRRRIRQLVSRPMQRGRPAAMLRSRVAQSGGDPAGQCRLQHRPDQGHHRSQIAVRGCPVHARGGSAAARPSSDDHPAGGGKRTGFVQPCDPAGQNGEQVMESKRQNSVGGDPGWIRTSDPQRCCLR
jgi:integrase